LARPIGAGQQATFADWVTAGKHGGMHYPAMVNRGNRLFGPTCRIMPKFKSEPTAKPKSKVTSTANLKPKAGRPAKAAATKVAKAPVPAAKMGRPGKLRRTVAPGTPDFVTASLEARLRKLTAQLAEAKGRIAELEGWAETDFLLDILNRRGFERELRRAVAYIARYGTSASLIVLDVDRLKPINDSFGHAAGDAVLKGIVNIVLKHIRSSDMVGRLGGDEFAVLLWNLSEEDALAKAAAIETAIDLLTFEFRGQSISTGASAGVAVLVPTDDTASVMLRADLAMYARKTIRRGPQ
jgi:diguanylate cyclase (GGDEF)-like protein